MPKVITGTWQNPDGSAVANGTLFLKLSQDAVAFGTAQLAPTIVAIQLDATGSIPTNISIYANDELIPNGTGYYTSVVQKGGGKVYGPDLLFLTGSGPINLNNFTPQGTRIVIFNQQNFTSNGTFTIPAGITSVKVMIVAGGGAGGGSTNAVNTAGSGGGAGSYATKWLSSLTPGNTLVVTVGTGGTAVAGATGGNGASSSVASGTQTITTITTNFGVGGVGSGGAFGAGGAAGTGGDLNFGGGPGVQFVPANVLGGPGGSGPWGGAGQGSGGTGVGGPGLAPGAGGGGAGGAGGAGNIAGGNGANGIVIFEWVQ